MHIQCAVQLHVHLKKWTLKFKLLYLRNYASYCNKICRISCVNTHIKSLKVWLKSILPWLKYSIFSRGLFFYCRTPYTSQVKSGQDITVICNILVEMFVTWKLVFSRASRTLWDATQVVTFLSMTKKMSGRTEKVTLFNAFLQAGLTDLGEIWHDGRS